MSLGGPIDQVSVLHLRYFLAVAEKGSVRAAADHVRIAQPSMSQHIGRLERRLGVRLFHRQPTGMTLTPDGERVAASARTFLIELQGATSDRSAVARVGVPRGVDEHVLRLLVDQFGEGVQFVRTDSAHATAALAQGEVDAALVHSSHLADGPDGTQPEAYDAHLGLLVSAAHPFANQQVLDWAQLDGQRLLWFDEQRAPDYARWLLEVCRTNSWDPQLHRMDPAGSNLVHDALIRSRDLVALRPRPESAVRDLVWIPLIDPPVERYVLLRRTSGP